MAERCPTPPNPNVIRDFVLALLCALVFLMGMAGLLVVAFGAEPAPTKVFTAKPERIPDGDTVVYPGNRVCRLMGIDAPEVAHGGKHTGQPLGAQALAGLQGELVRGPNTVLVYGTDKYGRMLCVILDDDGYMANLFMVESGLAATYLTERAPFKHGLEEAEKRAKQDRRGIWNLPNYESPSKYRQRVKARE